MSDWYCDELLSGRTPVDVLFEDDTVIAFRHTRPHYRHHVVVTTRRHIPSILECDAGMLVNIFEVVRAIAAQFIADHGGAHIVTNTGRYQESPHVHIHIGSE